MTIKARRLIENCDALVYDHLACSEALQWVPPGCAKYYVGKQSGAHCCRQSEIEDLLVQLAREGKRVVRLKGGDPFVFGRGGEEAVRLRAEGIRYEIVPAVTAALAAAAYAGIPLTHRQHSTALVFLSGHEDPEKEERIDWRQYAKLRATLCFYMAMKQLDFITWELMEGGLAPATPCAVVEKASTAEQRICVSNLFEVSDQVKRLQMKAPAIVIVGEVAAYAESLAWFEI